jgi:hypothetical protein
MSEKFWAYDGQKRKRLKIYLKKKGITTKQRN